MPGGVFLSQAAPPGFWLLLVVHDLVVGLDHVLRRATRRRAGLGPGLLGPGRAFLGRAGLALVERRAGRRVRRIELVQRGPDSLGLAGPKRLPAALDRGVEPGLRVGGELLDPFLAVLLDLVDQG